MREEKTINEYHTFIDNLLLLARVESVDRRVQARRLSPIPTIQLAAGRCSSNLRRPTPSTIFYSQRIVIKQRVDIQQGKHDQIPFGAYDGNVVQRAACNGNNRLIFQCFRLTRRSVWIVMSRICIAGIPIGKILPDVRVVRLVFVKHSPLCLCVDRILNDQTPMHLTDGAQ